MDIVKMTHFTLVNLKNFNRGNFYYKTVTLKLIEEESQCQKSAYFCLFFTSIRW